MSIDLPAFDSTTANDVARVLGIPYEPWMQDWPLEAADHERVEEFLRHYHGADRPEVRRGIVAVILCSLDKAFAAGPLPAVLLERAATVLKKHPELLEYWLCPEAKSEDEMFPITPWIRQL